MFVEVYYMRAEFFRTGILNPDVVDKGNLGSTHVKVAKYKNVDNFEEVFFALNHIEGKEDYPEEMKKSFEAGLIVHTSMSVGDVIKCGNECYVVDSMGWKKL